MAGFARIVCAAVAALLAAGVGGGAAAAPARAAEPATAGRGADAAQVAVASGERLMRRDELARIDRAVESEPATVIWRARLADGTLELSDRRPAGDATEVGRLSYPLPPVDVARRRAEAERAHWRRQAEAFERRRLVRERRDAIERRDRRPDTVVVVGDVPRHVVHRPPEPVPVEAYGVTVLPAPAGPGPRTAATPGAAGGRSAGGFIGSGFATSR